MIGEHRVGENSPSSECDPSPRRAAVDTGSKEPATPPQSPAISTGSGPEASQVETQMEEEISPTSMDGFLRSNCTSLEQEYNLIQPREEYILLQVQPEVGMDDSNNATTLQAAAREESARLPIGQQQGMTAWSTVRIWILVPVEDKRRWSEKYMPDDVLNLLNLEAVGVVRMNLPNIGRLLG